VGGWRVIQEEAVKEETVREALEHAALCSNAALCSTVMLQRYSSPLSCGIEQPGNMLYPRVVTSRGSAQLIFGFLASGPGFRHQREASKHMWAHMLVPIYAVYLSILHATIHIRVTVPVRAPIQATCYNAYASTDPCRNHRTHSFTYVRRKRQIPGLGSRQLGKPACARARQHTHTRERTRKGRRKRTHVDICECIGY
jgi:hypothetical protein